MSVEISCRAVLEGQAKVVSSLEGLVDFNHKGVAEVFEGIFFLNNSHLALLISEKSLVDHFQHA
jgi:hypothetical protein